MRLFAIFSVVVVAISGVVSTPVEIDLTSILGTNLASSNSYGAPLAPWKYGSVPGWYYGNYPERHRNIRCLKGWICKFLSWFPWLVQCPKPPHIPPPTSDGYTQTFANLTGATQAGDYMTYGLVDTIKDCKTMCNSVAGCKFANSYHDVNGKDGSTQLTCSLFATCHTASDATNTGGQTQPDGSIDYITSSDGWCKD
ncbi:hypothetical protein BDZ94DRAFT_1171838 [Collybia nuda]|uniref:Apple domain-containing protein n=1 Tax=Collybia nuda TaxID=64659 RepID=A0A9P5XX41_9AGAR|nr:hypothetical protein BDZ94DRAFT_1171838 [Collybia nuda]